LEQSIKTLRDFMAKNFPYSWQITIADNASADRTWEIARRLETEYPEVKARHLDRKGRGLALRTAWLESEADIVSYMDVDLSTGLDSFWPLVESILVGESEVATGSRLAKGARVTRQWKRELTSRGYNTLIKLFFFHKFSDAQCGFKAIRAETARKLLPMVENNAWFFDTELLLLAEHNRLPIFEIPVRWVEDLDSRVHIVKTALEDIKGLWRLRKSFWRGQGRITQPSTEPAYSETVPLKIRSEITFD
jgi:glycosyltransferase involved in cell wall biosynthesis